MNWDIFWLVVWSVAIFLTPFIFWLGGVGASVAAYNNKVALAVITFIGGIILGVLWLIIVAYNIINQVITLVNGG